MSERQPQRAVMQNGELALEFVENMARITLDRIGDHGIRNARENLRFIDQGESLKALHSAAIGTGERALVVAAGPSLHRMPVAERVKASAFSGAIIATDSALRYCLKNGITPDLVVTLDPHAKRIVRWFGDPHLTQADLDTDDYFSRQDMDRAFSDELRANQEILQLLDTHGKNIRLVLSTSASPAVVRRAVETGMKIYWWNPMYDDPDAPGSITRELAQMNGLPCVNAGGNVGAACWMMAHAVLEKKQVALTGVDFSYYDGTPYRNTQYYHEAVALVGEQNLDSLYVRIFNPHLSKWFYTDPAYLWYRNVFLEMARDADCKTYNCTEGGILFGEGVHFIRLEEFLNGATVE